MRPRTTFAILLAIGAVMHFVLAFRPPVSVGYLTLYLCWLVPSAAFAWSFWARSSATPSLSARGRRVRQSASSGLWMEGLGVFFVIATVGLVIQLLGPFNAYRPSIGASQWTQGSAMGLMFALSAAGCWALLRGAPGASAESLEDMVDIAITECERFFPAFQFVLWGDKSPQDALASAMVDAAGEA